MHVDKGSPHPLHSIGAEPPQPSSLPVRSPGASPKLGAAPRLKEPTPSPSLSSGAVDRAGELCISVARPPRCEWVPSTLSGLCVVVHGSAP
jgi:hypothetical protein